MTNDKLRRMETDGCKGCVSAINSYIGIMRNANNWNILPEEIGVLCLKCNKLWRIEGEDLGKWQEMRK